MCHTYHETLKESTYILKYHILLTDHFKVDSTVLNVTSTLQTNQIGTISNHQDDSDYGTHSASYSVYDKISLKVGVITLLEKYII